MACANWVNLLTLTTQIHEYCLLLWIHFWPFHALRTAKVCFVIFLCLSFSHACDFVMPLKFLHGDAQDKIKSDWVYWTWLRTWAWGLSMQLRTGGIKSQCQDPWFIARKEHCYKKNSATSLIKVKDNKTFLPMMILISQWYCFVSKQLAKGKHWWCQ